MEHPMSGHVETKSFQMPPGGSSVARAQLIKYLTDANRDVVTDAEIMRDLGYETHVDGKHYQQFLRAIHYVAKHQRVQWKRAAGAGCVTRLDVDGIHGLVESKRKHQRREATRAVVALHCADITKLDDKRKTTHLTALAQQGMLATVASSRTTKAIEARAAFKPPTLRQLMDAVTEKVKD